jgi:hypothetical protein
VSVLGGAAGIALTLIAEEVIVTAEGGPAAIAGFFGSAAKVLDHLADPTVPGIPDLTVAKASTTPATTTPGLPGRPGTSNPIEAPPAGSTAPVRDYNPSQLAPGGVL